jgi:hypothetical protein
MKLLKKVLERQTEHLKHLGKLVAACSYLQAELRQHSQRIRDALARQPDSGDEALF